MLASNYHKLLVYKFDYFESVLLPLYQNAISIVMG